jgi:hypothetical protein
MVLIGREKRARGSTHQPYRLGAPVLDDEVTRDKSKDPPKPKTDPGITGLPK